MGDETQQDSFRIKLSEAFSALAEVIAEGIDDDESDVHIIGITFVEKQTVRILEQSGDLDYEKSRNKESEFAFKVREKNKFKIVQDYPLECSEWIFEKLKKTFGSKMKVLNHAFVILKLNSSIYDQSIDSLKIIFGDSVDYQIFELKDWIMSTDKNFDDQKQYFFK